MKYFRSILSWLISCLRKYRLRKFKNISASATIARTAKIYNPENIVMDENTNISGNSTIMNTRAKFIIKKNSGAAFGLTVVTGNHVAGIVGKFRRFITNEDKNILDPNGTIYDKDIVVEEDVWIGSNVSLLFGSRVGRGAIIGNGSVVRNAVPPYSIVIGNPAKVIGFVFTPDEVVEHERLLYPEDERIPVSTLEKNYQKFFIKRIKEITNYIKL